MLLWSLVLCTADTLTRNVSGVVICSLHEAARAKALPSPGFDMYVGVKVATAEELASVAAAPPGEAAASVDAAAPAEVPQLGLGNLGDALVCCCRPSCRPCVLREPFMTDSC